ncbi:lysoplasmalogenase TMEM86A-like [Palaemon carinicauda]|uniref:lysoplasmalogenase TMEM86A-like n=1 Tax=Palaemon carinicauda TaxID=392227 RepID=UPI0035B657F9
MATPKQVLKSIGPKLVPFFKTVAIYFVLFIPVEQPSIFAMVIKCLPILSLIAFVLLHGMSLGEEYAYSRRILLGLICSVFGDALLIWDELFIHGLSAFLIAQCFYVSAFGFRPFNIYAATVVYSAMTIGLYLLMPGTSGVISFGMPIYTFLLMTMVWRAVARVQLFEELWTWTKLCSCMGGILFAVSDGCIGFNEFYGRVPHSQAIIMVTYYAAQLGISLSVVDSKASYLDSLRDNKNSVHAYQTSHSDSEEEHLVEQAVNSSHKTNASIWDSSPKLIHRQGVFANNIPQ